MSCSFQKDPVPPGLQLPHDGGALRVVELHADLHEGLLLREAVQKGQGLFPAVKITGDDHVLTHALHLL